MMIKIGYTSLALVAFWSSAESTQNIERVRVVAKPPAYQSAILRIIPEQSIVDQTSFSSDSLASLLTQSPSVNLNGQGGLLQAINIRGFARWRIQTLIEGVPIYTDRRAGTSMEFIPPNFVEQIFVVFGATCVVNLVL